MLSSRIVRPLTSSYSRIVRPLTSSPMTRVSLYSHTSTLLSLSPSNTSYPFTLDTLIFQPRRLWELGHPWFYGWCLFTLFKIPWKFRVDISIRSVSGMGVLGGHWRFLIRTGSSLRTWMTMFDPQDLDDVEGSWPKTKRTLMSLLDQRICATIASPLSHLTGQGKS